MSTLSQRTTYLSRQQIVGTYHPPTFLAKSLQFERIVLRWAQTQVQPKINQYGGQKGCATAHFLADIWDQITDHLEDQRATAVLTAIDYSKAFNRLEHGSVLRAFCDAGASNQVLSILASFLIGRSMTVRVGDKWSSRRAVNAGAPQGSVLGTYIFNVGTDTLEDGFHHEDSTSDDEDSDNGIDLLFLETQSRQPHAVSTPTRPTFLPDLSSPFQCSPLPSRPNNQEQIIELLPRVVNPPVTTGRRVEPSWRHREVTVRKFVDDNQEVKKLYIKDKPTLYRNGEYYKQARAPQSEAMFQHISRRAVNQGLVVNTKRLLSWQYLEHVLTKHESTFMTIRITE